MHGLSAPVPRTAQTSVAPSHSVTPSHQPESKRMTPGHEQNYFTSSEHRIFELTIKQFGTLNGDYSLCNKLLESVYGIDVIEATAAAVFNLCFTLHLHQQRCWQHLPGTLS